jgi:hypothetical protein
LTPNLFDKQLIVPNCDLESKYQKTMEFEAKIKASQADQNAKEVNLDNMDVYRQQYNHLLSWSAQIGSYERCAFHGEIRF